MFLEAEVNEVIETRHHPRSGHHPGRHHNGCPSETQCSCSYAPGLTGRCVALLWGDKGPLSASGKVYLGVGHTAYYFSSGATALAIMVFSFWPILPEQPFERHHGALPASY
jgi:hypothetical protein